MAAYISKESSPIPLLQEIRKVARQYRTPSIRAERITTLVLQEFERSRSSIVCHGDCIIQEDKADRFTELDLRPGESICALLGLIDEAPNDSSGGNRTGALKRKAEAEMSDLTRKCVQSAEWISEKLSDMPDFEWSCAVLPLCKALENEIHERMLLPLRQVARTEDLQNDTKDKDLSRVAKYCSGRAIKPPEIGTFAYFLNTAIHSTDRRERSRLLQIFFHFIAAMSNADWLTSAKGLPAALKDVTEKYRNPAAHIEALSRKHFEECQKFLTGNNGVLWKFIDATRMRPSQ